MKYVVLPAAMLAFSMLVNSCSKSTGDDGSGNPPPVQQKDIAVVDGKVDAFLNTYSLAGASLAVSKNGKLVYKKGYGQADKSSGATVKTDALFRLASVSKTYTGVAIMKLVQEGKLSLEDNVFGSGAVLGTTYGTQPYSDKLLQVKVKHLLKHTGGGWGAASGGDPIDLNPAQSNTDFFNWVLNNKPLQNTPGTKFDYSNMGYFILGRIIEKKSGKSYIGYLQTEILNGLGDVNTQLAGKTEAERKANEVKYYAGSSLSPYVYTIAFPRRDADGGLITTATDLLRLINAVDGFSTRPDILNSSTITSFTTPSGPAPLDPNYACGIAVWNNVWYNYGSLPGTRTGFMRGNNGVSVSLLLNAAVDYSNSSAFQAFTLAQQDLMLSFVNDGSIPWQDIDQFE